MKELRRNQLHQDLSRLSKATAVAACRAMVTTNGDFLFSVEKDQELTFSLSGTHKSLYGTELETWDMEGMEREMAVWSATTDGNLEFHSSSPSAFGI